MNFKEQLIKSMEGKIYLSVYLIQMNDHISVVQDRYVLVDGSVHLINGDKTEKTDDDPIDLVTLKCLGDFDPKHNYEKINPINLSTTEFIDRIY